MSQYRSPFVFCSVEEKKLFVHNVSMENIGHFLEAAIDLPILRKNSPSFSMIHTLLTFTCHFSVLVFDLVFWFGRTAKLK